MKVKGGKECNLILKPVIVSSITRTLRNQMAVSVHNMQKKEVNGEQRQTQFLIAALTAAL